jgi:penicillin-binding protein-related factor A (putative recombinase)
VIVHFTLHDTFYLLPIEWIQQYLNNHSSKTIKYEDIQKECLLLTIVYPGILNLVDNIK